MFTKLDNGSDDYYKQQFDLPIFGKFDRLIGDFLGSAPQPFIDPETFQIQQNERKILNWSNLVYKMNRLEMWQGTVEKYNL